MIDLIYFRGFFIDDFVGIIFFKYLQEKKLHNDEIENVCVMRERLSVCVTMRKSVCDDEREREYV